VVAGSEDVSSSSHSHEPGGAPVSARYCRRPSKTITPVSATCDETAGSFDLDCCLPAESAVPEPRDEPTCLPYANTIRQRIALSLQSELDRDWIRMGAKQVLADGIPGSALLPNRHCSQGRRAYWRACPPPRPSRRWSSARRWSRRGGGLHRRFHCISRQRDLTSARYTAPCSLLTGSPYLS
jgi:hypothetical protein